MFVPKGTLSSGSSQRNLRRRQRTGSDDSVNPPKPKRQRSAPLQRDLDTSSESHTGHSRYEATDNATPSTYIEAYHTSNDSSTAQKSLPIRSSKKFERRDNETEGTVVLSETEFYTVSQLPTLPDQIRGLHSEDFRCFFGGSHDYALALTHTHAIVWPYSIAASAPSPSDVYTLALPESCKDPGGVLSMGVLLSTTTTGIPGLMVVMPHTGKILYWESVSSAASLGLPRQKQSGIQGCISNLLSGEVVADMINAEPSGVIVTLSTGRVAHITVRDSQGKATVSVNFLRNSSSGGRAGIFGGIKNVLGGNFGRKDLAAVRVGESTQRGQRDIIIANTTGLVEIWDTHWNHGSVLKKQFDLKDHLCESLGSASPNVAGHCGMKILDFAVTPTERFNDGNHDEEHDLWHLSLVVASYTMATEDISLIQVELSHTVNILSIIHVELRGSTAKLNESKPQLLLPKPGDTAFIVIGNSVILMSLDPVKDSPTRQLMTDTDRPPQPFHDTINFRSGRDFEILGRGVEDQSHEFPLPACLLMVRDFGVIRIAALPRQNIEADGEEVQITAKHKIEQAIFYGTISGNPLSLGSGADLDFTAREIEQAALTVCRELLQATSKFIPTTAISITQNLKSRAKALDDLASLLMRQNKMFDHLTWWELLWSAEKVAAQRAMWQFEEDAMKANGKGQTFLSRVIELMNEKFKTNLDRQGNECDPVRNWFLNDTYRMEHIIPWIFNAIKPQKGKPSLQGRKVSEQILEASELSLAVLETAFRFRDEHASQYGLGDGYLEDGVLITGYHDLPEFWTSQNMSYTEAGRLLDLELDSCRAWIQQNPSTAEAPEIQTLKKISRNSSRQLRVLGQMHSERIRWLSAQNDAKLADESVVTEQAHLKQRKWQLFKLAGIGRLQEAIALAEKFKDMDALVELIIELQDQHKVENISCTIEDTADTLTAESDELGEKISFYFENFGEKWSNAFFSRQISMGQAGILFAMKKFQPFITQFLRTHPAYSRLSWINDVLGEDDCNAAAHSLKTLALEDEKDIWSHRVELSISKIAKLATLEETGAPAESMLHGDIRRLDDLAEIDAVQEVIYAYIAPILQGAIDRKAEHDLAIDHFGRLVAEDRPSLHELLGEALDRVIARHVIGVDQLIDLLTLMYSEEDSNPDQNELLGKEFYLALRVIRLGLHSYRDPRYCTALQKLVWRRCLIKDDWVERGKAAEALGQESEHSVYTTALFSTLSSCLGERHGEDTGGFPLYIPTCPQDVLMGEMDFEILASRFRAEQRNRIGRDFERENEILRHYVEHGKLGFWFNNLLVSREGNASPSLHGAAESDQGEQPKKEGSKSAETSTSKAQLSWL
ncbi:hypothetical protein FE257_003139 [Aspergillus nanangensis]|uniref:Non-repetitive/WGA-negative nucleoporin C-terminal-domain-containing protein n=1 Tax=Aspergillus nanangensis TaxID=2582783 RepID=A0AAD4GNP5_ASPNN|nr:hypothetical protein FE257_003139 [Aspergillus nanangensis]